MSHSQASKLEEDVDKAVNRFVIIVCFWSLLLRFQAMTLTYSSRPLSRELRFQHWYQWVILGIALLSLAFPIATYVIAFVQYRYKRYKARPVILDIKGDSKIKSLLESVTNTPYSRDSTFDVLPQTENYCIYKAVPSVPEVWSSSMVAVPHTLTAEALKVLNSGTAQIIMCYIDMEAYSKGNGEKKENDRAVDVMQTIHEVLREESRYDGVILPLCTKLSIETWMSLAKHLRTLNLFVLFEVDAPYNDLDGHNLTLVDGLVIRNATMLPDGTRRDFFRAFKLRDILARCARQKANRGAFSTILYDAVHSEPTTATIRRSYKFARFHEVTLSICNTTESSHLQELPLAEASSAFDWLKDLNVLKLHSQWNASIVMKDVKAVTESVDEDLLKRLEPIFGDLFQYFVRRPVRRKKNALRTEYPPPPDWTETFEKRPSFFSFGDVNQALNSSACYDLREQVVDQHVQSILETQRHLRDLKMLTILDDEKSDNLITRCNAFLQSPQATSLKAEEHELISSLISELKTPALMVYTGLDSGFCLPDNQFRVWAVQEIDSDGQTIYVSQKSHNYATTILHIYLISHLVPRDRCFEIERLLSESENTLNEFGSPPCISSEMELATYAELLSFLHHLRVCEDRDSSILVSARLTAYDLLLARCSASVWKNTHGFGLLNGDLSTLQMYEMRLAWYLDQGFSSLPDATSLTFLHDNVEGVVKELLKTQNTAIMKEISNVLAQGFDANQNVSIELDLLATMVFCAFRKYAVEEVYLEATDRCPLFHFVPDQAGVYSELWAIGSQCDVYFDMTPRQLGHLHYKKYRKHLEAFPPQKDAWDGIHVFTAYTKVDNPSAEGELPGDDLVVNPFKKKNPQWFPRMQKFAFLSIFCIPAVFDVMLLVFLGRGVYQSAFMSSTEIEMGTLGLLTALLLCSGIIAWIGSTGGYYLFNYAFDSLNHVMVQRLSGGLMLCSAVGILGGLAIGAQQGWYHGLIFFLYLMVLSTYLTLLGILATMHRDGSPLPSGRYTLWKCMPILLISPIVTTFWNHHDIIVYMVVLYIFLGVLFLNYRSLAVEWSQWHLKIKLTDDKAILRWYCEQFGAPSGEMIDLETARSSLEREVLKYRSSFRLPWVKDPAAELVKDLAPGLEYTRWLLARELPQGVPEPYSSAWNNQLKVTLVTYQNFLRGLKEHNAYLQFRYAKNDIGYNCAVFIAALLDRWVAITMSAAGDGPLNLYTTPRNRFAIAFALSYFLLSAVALDYHLQFCWSAIVKTSSRPIKSIKNLDDAESFERGRKSKLYWSSLWDLVRNMMIFFGIMSLMLVFWVEQSEQLFTFFSYVVAYTGVIWLQYNRVFIPNPTKAFGALVISVSIGYFTGVVLHLIPSTWEFHYIDIIALGTSSISATILSFCLADFGPDRSEAEDDVYSPTHFMEKTKWKTHSQKLVGLSKTDTRELQQNLKSLDLDKLPLDLIEITSANTPKLCSAIIDLLSTGAALQSKCNTRVPRGLQNLCEEVMQMWQSGAIRLRTVSSTTFANICGSNVSAVGQMKQGLLSVIVSVPISSTAWFETEANSFARLLCEALLHETSEIVRGSPHSHAVVAELLLPPQGDYGLSGRIEGQLKRSSRNQAKVMVKQSHTEIISHQVLGIRDINTQWSTLSEDVRKFLLRRVLGEQISDLSHGAVQELTTRLAGCHDLHEHILYSNTSLTLAHSIYLYCLHALDSFVLTRDKIYTPEVQQDTGRYVNRSNPWYMLIYYGLYNFFKYIAIISVGEPDVPRELVYVSRNTNLVLRVLIRKFILYIWLLCFKVRQILLSFVLLHSRPELKKILDYRLGTKRIWNGSVLHVEDFHNPLTGFAARQGNVLQLRIYNGNLISRPGDDSALRFVCYYSDGRLNRREIYEKGLAIQTISYTYGPGKSRIPLSRNCTTLKEMRNEVSQYDEHGLIVSGSRYIDGCSCDYLYTWSRNVVPELLKATYQSMQTSATDTVCVSKMSSKTGIKTTATSVFWAEGSINARSSLGWNATQKVARVVRTENEETYDLQWTYQHNRDPQITATHSAGKDDLSYLSEAPSWLTNDANDLYKKPVDVAFESEDLLLFHNIGFSTTRIRKDQTKRIQLSTGALRTILWASWHKSKSLDGVTACFIDQLLLRDDKALSKYWSLRDSGRLRKAGKYLNDNIGLILSSTQILDSVSQTTFLPVKISDLLTFGSGGSANIKTRNFEENYHDTQDRLSVIFLDTGCFPDQPGGVSNCRRDLVDGHTTIRNHCFTESANDFGVPRYQVDKSVQSIKVLPLWGLDYLSPYHGLFENLLDSQVEYREHHTTDQDITNIFIPIFKTIVKGSRSLSYTQEDLQIYTQAFLDMSYYFENKDYNKTWRSSIVKRVWREMWLADQENMISTSTYFTLEVPTMSQFDEALELWLRYFFVFSVRIPEQVPKVFQCTHHGVGSLFGMLLKLRRGTTFKIWDHAIYFRESCLNISAAQCILPLSVQNMLLGVVRLASNLAYTHADIILPCTDLFNPTWEVDIGTNGGKRQSQVQFARKIDPVVNGISGMDRFKPVEKIQSVDPTVMMLSNIQMIKDVKNAVLAADIIVNTFGFKTYRLVIYGALDRDPPYCAETQAIIKNRNLGENVKLAGFGNPAVILKDAWAFMNSSLSEGLPLAIGEAALSGAPIIATDVGATASVISDPNNSSIRYGEIVPPNDSLSLARAQIQILAMMGPWVQYCADQSSVPILPEKFTPADVERITKRMYDKTEDRRRLGLKGREVVLKSFNGDRYLREHEQMYWVASHRALQRADNTLSHTLNHKPKYGEIEPIIPDLREESAYSKLWSVPAWRYFVDRPYFIEKLKRKAQERKRNTIIDDTAEIVELVERRNSCMSSPPPSIKIHRERDLDDMSIAFDLS